MREILFRGKTHKGEWVQGSLKMEYGWRVIEGKRQLDHIICDLNGLCNHVDPTTVGQYTGMTDKNGTKIFEDDIIYRNWHGGRVYRVIYNHLFGAFIGRAINEAFTTFEGDSDLFEVIGNIHDNPELLNN